MFSRKMILGRIVTGATLIAGMVFGSSVVANAQTGDRGAASKRAAIAQRQADGARRRAAELASGGGWAYKAGLVQRAEGEAARHQAEANAAMLEAASCPRPSSPSPAQAAALARLTELRQAGGWAYKTGAVARAERDVQALASDETEPVAVSPAQAAALARLAELRQAGGWAYKTGAVARAEREVQTLATSASMPTSICGVSHAPTAGLAVWIK